MAAYSIDLRLRVLRDADAGLPSDELAEKYSVSRAWVDRLKQRRRETGEVAPRKQTRWRTPILQAQLAELAALIREQPDRTLAELQEALRTPASLPTLCRTIKRLGFRFKKNFGVALTASPARSGAPRRRRSIPRASLDESGVRTDHSPLAVGPHAGWPWHTTTFLGALRVTGLTAPAVFDGPIRHKVATTRTTRGRSGCFAWPNIQ